MPKTRKNRTAKGGANVSGLTAKGGAAIAEGKWGCVFSPPYPCAVPNQPVFNFPVVSKLVIDTPEIRKEIASSHIVREKLKGLVAAIPIHVCRPGPPTEEESRITFKSRKACSQLMHQDLSDGVLIYMPYVGTETAKDYFKRTDATVDNILYFFSNTIESIKRLASFDPFLIHLDLHAGNILALENGESALCDFGMSISNDKRTGKFIDNIKEWWNKRSWNFEDRITKQTICPLTLLTIAKLGNPEIDYVERLRAMNITDSPINIGMWNTYIHHIVLPRFKAMVEVGNPILQKKAILAAIRFNDIHAICVLLMEYLEKINPDIVMQAHGQLMAGAGGGYFSRSVDSMMSYIENTAKTNKLGALAVFSCLGAMDTFVFVPDVPVIYSNIWLMIKNY